MRNLLTLSIMCASISAVALPGCSRLQALPTSQLTATAQTPARARNERVLYSFKKSADGWQPLSSLALDSEGSVYGTTKLGGANNLGTVFALALSPAGYTERILHSFADPPDGFYPNAGVSLDSKGTLYGTTPLGGTYYGTVFELLPSGSSYVEKIVHSFNPFSNGDGASPYAGVTIGSNGVLYGTASAGGYGAGMIFILKPSGSGYGQTGFAFGEGNNGAAPYGGVILKNGFLFGTTSQGGRGNFGTVFQVKATDTTGAPIKIHSFSGSNGASPQSSLVLGKNGTLYGTTVNGGSANGGTVFRLERYNRRWIETVLYSFTGSADGTHPHGAPLLGDNGIIYGTAAAGGVHGNGVVFALAPSGTGYAERTVYSFKGVPDGAAPMSGLILGKNGELLGTTQSGGKADRGTVFAINP